MQFERPLDRLRRGELDKFFGQEQRRLAPYTQGLERGALVAWVWDQTGDGVFEDAVLAIYRGCKTHFQALRPGGPA